MQKFFGLNKLTTAVGMIALLGMLVLPFTVDADEIWLTPQERNPNKTVGNWAVAKLGPLGKKETHFVWHVPDNYDEDASQPDIRAIVVLIASKSGATILYRGTKHCPE